MSTSVESPAEVVDGLVRTVPDFPKPGIEFYDIAPVLASARGLKASVDALIGACPLEVDVVVGVEARGFIVGAPVAIGIGSGFVPVRKPGKLPGPVISHSYTLEYGEATLAVQQDAFEAGARVLLVDDVLATGGTIAAAAALTEQLGGVVVGVSVLLELAGLGGRENLRRAGLGDVHAVVTR
ncbi:MAG TPA: adenine phosphoribosyltransferase [Candidatus Avipropionibacterium avicola]|uniref:Adenine phosphoribosyltransferase n=1 Tax=Candidatus Avipropionibacterium avicola TaxID=2840701 RepID=A0A9D1H016_9ACTN|nr:adenine phosphoribosyltransferase [Candidatus Avipropionibacterium avicola]